MNMMIQTRTGSPIVDAVATLNITGNVIPEAWYHTIVNEKGKVNCLAIHILADIVYWYRPTETETKLLSLLPIPRNFTMTIICSEAMNSSWTNSTSHVSKRTMPS